MEVVITGIGLVTPLGFSPTEIFNNIQNGNNAALPPPFSAEPFSCKFSRPVGDFDPSKFGLDVKSLRLMSRDAIFAAVAARLAVSDAGLVIGKDYSPDEVALFGATGLSGIAFEEVSQIIKNSARPDGSFDPQKFGAVALKKILPTLSFKILTNMPICFISIFEGIQGMNAIYNPWEGQAARAIAAGIEAIQSGHASCALVGGCDVKTNILGFIGLQQHGLFPEESEFAGSYPGEGGGFLVLEKEDLAEKLNRRIYSRIHLHSSWAEKDFHTVSEIPESPLERVSSVIRSWPEKSTPGQVENRFIDKYAEGVPVVDFSKSLGNLYAANPAVYLGLGAGMVHDKSPAEERVLVNILGAGSEKAVFLLETPTSQVKPSASIPAEGKITNPDSSFHRVVVTGLGIAGPIGIGREDFWKNAVAGRSGIGKISLFDASKLSVNIGGEVKSLDIPKLKEDFPESAVERDRKIFLALLAAREALADSGFSEFSDILNDATIHLGVSLEVFFLDDVTPYVHLPNLDEAMAKALSAKKHLPPLQTPLDRAADILGNHFGIFGGRYTICSACASGAQVIGEALNLLRSGKRKMALVGAADSMLNPLGLGGFSLLRALSTENNTPQRACRPFDVTRMGTVLGEGAGFLVLETLSHARNRGAKILAEVLGYGSSMDSYRVSDPEPSGRGAILSMKKALSDARLNPDEVSCINAHGTGTPKNDVVETLAIKAVFGDRAKKIPVHSIKSMTGHLIGASGAVEAVASILALNEQMVPPTINLENPDPDCDLDYVPLVARPFTGNTVLSNSFGFGGQNAALIFARFP